MANVVTSVGKAIAAARMIGATPTQLEPKFVGWGTGAGTSAAADTTLFTESAETRATGAGTVVTTTTTNDTHQIVGTLTATAARSITNAGVFDASTVGNLYVKGDFTAIALNTGDSIQFTFKVTFA